MSAATRAVMFAAKSLDKASFEMLPVETKSNFGGRPHN